MSTREEQREKADRAMAMRKAGATYPEIAKAIGCTRVWAITLVQRELKRVKHAMDEGGHASKALTHERWEEIIRRIWVHALPPGSTKMVGPDGVERTVPAPPNLKYLHALMKALENYTRFLDGATPKKYIVEIHARATTLMQEIISIAADIMTEEQRITFQARLEGMVTKISSLSAMIEEAPTDVECDTAETEGDEGADD